MPGQSDYGTLDRRHEAEREQRRDINRTAVYAVLASINIKRHRKTMSHETTKRKTILHLNSTFGRSTSFVLSPLKSHLVFLDAIGWPRLLSLPLLITLRPPRCVSTGSVAVRLAEMAI